MLRPPTCSARAFLVGLERWPEDAQSDHGGLDGTRARIPASETMANEYVYAKDVGRAVDLAATVPMPKQIAFNIGNGVVTPFRSCSRRRNALSGLSYEVEPGEARTPSWRRSISRPPSATSDGSRASPLRRRSRTIWPS